MKRRKNKRRKLVEGRRMRRRWVNKNKRKKIENKKIVRTGMKRRI